MKTFLIAALSLSAALSAVASAQTSAPAVPQNHIPAPVVMEMRMLERQFDAALGADCAPERCFSKGCNYVNHVAVDLPRSGSLPGLGQGEGPGSVPPQEYLTEARCEFTHEKAVPQRDVQALVNRLQQRLSKGWMKVSVGTQILAPISPSLRESPLPKEDRPPVLPPPEPVLTPEPKEPPKWDAAVAVRELWVSLLPHFAWMIALVLTTLSILALIWGARRVGRESLEEKALAAQLAAGTLAGPEEEKKEESPLNGAAAHTNGATPPSETTNGAEDPHFVRDQQQLWNDRIAQAEFAKDEGGVVELLRQWLVAGEFELLAKAIYVFGDKLSLAFSNDGQLAVRKVEFADFLKSLDEKTLLTDGDFFRVLNQHAISSSLLSQDDVEVYRSLREEFGSSGVLRLVESLPPRHGALLFGIIPGDTQVDVARIMAPELRLEVADQLLVSNRISKEETSHVFEVLNAARAGKPLPPPPRPHGIPDRGREFDAAGALSVLMARIEPSQRSELFARALERSGGTFPRWYEDILYGDMLLRLPEEMRKDMLLGVDVRGLAAWASVQNPQWQESFLGKLAPSMQAAVRASMAFASRADQLRHARRGQHELVAAMKKQVSQGRVSFAEMVA